jgi:hypothetical protein
LTNEVNLVYYTLIEHRLLEIRSQLPFAIGFKFIVNNPEKEPFKGTKMVGKPPLFLVDALCLLSNRKLVFTISYLVNLISFKYVNVMFEVNPEICINSLNKSAKFHLVRQKRDGVKQALINSLIF